MGKEKERPRSTFEWDRFRSMLRKQTERKLGKTMPKHQFLLSNVPAELWITDKTLRQRKKRK